MRGAEGEGEARGAGEAGGAVAEGGPGGEREAPRSEGLAPSAELLSYYRRRLDELEGEQQETIQRFKRVEVRSWCAVRGVAGRF